MLALVRDSALRAVTGIGTSWRRSSRFSAVTTISCKPSDFEAESVTVPNLDAVCAHATPVPKRRHVSALTAQIEGVRRGRIVTFTPLRRVVGKSNGDQSGGRSLYPAWLWFNAGFAARAYVWLSAIGSSPAPYPRVNLAELLTDALDIAFASLVRAFEKHN